MKWKRSILALGILLMFISFGAADHGGITTPSDNGYSGFIGLMFGFPNDIAGGLLGSMMLLMIFVPTFTAGAYSGDIMKAYLAAGFITLGSAIFLLAFQIIGSNALIASAIAYLLGLALIDR